MLTKRDKLACDHSALTFNNYNSLSKKEQDMGKDKLINGVNRCNLSGSYKTQYNHRLEATRFVEQLRKNGYGVQRWQNVTNKHVASVVNSWKEQGLSNKTIKEYLSGVRAIASAYGNDKISQSNSDFGLEKGQSTPSNIDKSANEQIYREVVDRLSQSDKDNINEQRLSVQIEYMRELGLRHEEARKLDAVNAERQYSPSGKEYIRITDGCKGGKERWVPVSERAQAALERGAKLQRQAGTKNLMDPRMSERQWERYAYRTARELGMSKENGCTFHSLRHSFAQELFRQRAGFNAPVKFSSKEEFRAAARAAAGDNWKQNYERACKSVENALGHGSGRDDIRGTYIGRI
jgi:site-specific recombinase XerD